MDHVFVSINPLVIEYKSEVSLDQSICDDPFLINVSVSCMIHLQVWGSNGEEFM